MSADSRTAEKREWLSAPELRVWLGYARSTIARLRVRGLTPRLAEVADAP